MSELRVIELLEGLCDALANYALWTPSAAWVSANPEADAERRWVRISGAGADVQGATGACRAGPALQRERELLQSPLALMLFACLVRCR